MPAKTIYDGKIGIIAKLLYLINHAVAEEALKECKENCPVKTGRLRDSITLEQIYPLIIISANTPYAAAVEFGRAPLVITPKTKQVLKFEKYGKTIYAKYARQPARMGQFFMMKSGMKVKEKFPIIVEKVLSRGVRA